MDKNTKSIVIAILFGSFLVASTVAVIGRYQITGGPEGVTMGNSSYVVRDTWTGKSWWEQIRKY